LNAAAIRALKSLPENLGRVASPPLLLLLTHDWLDGSAVEPSSLTSAEERGSGLPVAGVPTESPPEASAATNKS